MKKRYNKLRNWIKVVTLLYEKTSKQSKVDKNLKQEEAVDLKIIYNHYLDKKYDIMKNTQFRVEDTFCDILGKKSFSPEQIFERKKILTKIILI